jgi:thiamine biosynthesis lipoprotein
MIQKLSKPTITRRRFMIMASALGTLPAMPSAAFALNGGMQPVNWTGGALGAEASIQLFHHDTEWARGQLDRCQQEIYRLENLFSLYQPNSAICRLNAEGYLNNPDIEFLNLLSLAKSFSRQTNGLFDVTVQPLWKLYVDHFSRENADPAGPSSSEITEVLKIVGSSKVNLTADRIGFENRGMAITLNGVAQGYITDRIASLLKSAGFENVMVSLGEKYALGGKPDGNPWCVGILSPENGKTIATNVNLTNKALATSGGYGSPFSSHSSANHLLNPLTGKCAEFRRSVSVISTSATHADMASTALTFTSEEDGNKLVTKMPLIEDVIYL